MIERISQKQFAGFENNDKLLGIKYYTEELSVFEESNLKTPVEAILKSSKRSTFFIK